MEVKVFTVSYGGSSIDPFPIEVDGLKQLNQFQKEVFTSINDTPYSIINAPTGNGKTMSIENISYCHLVNKKYKHIIIIAPQTVIVDQYGYNKFVASNGDKVLWNIPKSNIYGTTGKPIANLTNNLKKDPTHLMTGIHLATHAGFISWFKDANNKELLNDCLIVIDEIHHGMSDEIDGVEISNQLGEVKNWIFEQDNVGFVGMSATLFRSDGLKIISSKYRDDVVFYHYEYDRYLQGFEHTKKFDYNMLYYNEPHPLERIKDIYDKHGHQKEIIYLPYVGSRYCWENKNKEVKDIFNTIGINVRKDGIFTYVEVDGIEKKYIDLVNESQRKKKKIYLKGNCDDLDGIIALGMGKEGFDWKQCQRLIVLGARTSIVEVHQIYGRLTRDYPGKESVCLYHILPKPITGNIEETTNEYLLNFYFARQYGELMQSLSSIVPDPGKGKYIKGLGIPRIRLLPEVLNGDFCACTRFKIECERQLGDYREANPGISIFKMKKKFEEIVELVLVEDHGVVQDDLDELTKTLGVSVTWKSVAKQCWTIWTIDGFRVKYPGEPLDFKVVDDMSPDEDLRWFGTNVLDIESWSELSKKIKYYDFYYTLNECKKVIKNLNLLSSDDFKIWRRSEYGDKKIPIWPNSYYPNEWIDWYDFLSRKRPKDYIIPLNELKNIVQPLNFKSQTEYKSWAKRTNISAPLAPGVVYQKDWKGWYDFLGKEKPYNTLKECKEAVFKLHLNSQTEFRKYISSINRNFKIPSAPEKVYKDEWVDWYDFIGKDKPKDFYNTLEECKKIIQPFNFKSMRDFRKWRNSEDGDKKTHSTPERFYKNEWISDGNFLREELPFYNTLKECKKIIQPLNFKSRKEFQKWRKSMNGDKKIPCEPENTYDNWISDSDFFRNEIKQTLYDTLEECKKIIQPLNFKSRKEFIEWRKSPVGDKKIPTTPCRTYEKEWISWHDFLGKEKYKFYNTLKECKHIVQKQNITSMEKFNIWRKSPDGDKRIPATVWLVYKDEWIDFYDFFGKTK